MANTRRKTAASSLSRLQSRVGLFSQRPKYINGNGLARQEGCETPSDSFETVISLIAARAKIAAELHVRCGGSTVSIDAGSLVGLPRFAVSIYPQHTITCTVPPIWEMLFAFAIFHADLLLLPDHAFGTWQDREQNLHVVDVVICPSSVDMAIALGLRHGQKAVYDLEAGREISFAPMQERTMAVG